MTYRQLVAAQLLLEREGWGNVQVRYDGDGRRSYGITAQNPDTGRTIGPWWAPLGERQGD